MFEPLRKNRLGETKRSTQTCGKLLLSLEEHYPAAESSFCSYKILTE
jgi:hypothetical protein